MRELRAYRKEAGLCYTCGGSVIQGDLTCSLCRAKRRARYQRDKGSLGSFKRLRSLLIEGLRRRDGRNCLKCRLPLPADARLELINPEMPVTWDNVQAVHRRCRVVTGTGQVKELSKKGMSPYEIALTLART